MQARRWNGATWCGLALAIALAAGCIQVGNPSRPATSDADDGVTTLQLTVVDSASGEGLSGAHVTLLITGKGSLRKDTDHDGRVSFNVDPAAACSVAVERAGYRGGAVALDCLTDRAFRVPLDALRGGSSESPSTVPVPSGGLPKLTVAPPGSFLLRGLVLDDAAGQPVRGAIVRLDPPKGDALATGADGRYAFVAVPGVHRLTVTAACWTSAEFEVDVKADTTLDLRLTTDTVPPAVPQGLRATPGPGAGMVTVSWSDVPDAAGFQLLRNGQPLLRLGHSLAYGVPGASASDRFSVAALDACGHPSPASAEASASPLPGLPAPAVTSSAVQVTLGSGEWAVLDADGAPVGTRSWRTVAGTGNCCENYVATTPDGTILDLGGSTIAISHDEGRTWEGIHTPLKLIDGEGAIAAAPDGDIVAFDWATYNADTAFSYRYSAATREWSSLPVVKAPVYDRPWIATIKGPFEVPGSGLVVPYVTIVEGGTGLKDPLLVSYDGVTYVPSNDLASLSGRALFPVATLPDSNRDWIQPIGEFEILPVDNGLGYDYNRGVVLAGTPAWGSASIGDTHGDVLRIDSKGTLHAASADGDSFRYAISHDGGAHWTEQTFSLPSGWSAGEWDFRVNAALDEAVYAVNADDGGLVKQAALRFRGLDGTPVLTETLLVGNGDGRFGSGVLENGNRFDFMTVGFLPDGRIVMSAADATGSAPFLAIELPDVPAAAS